MEKAQINNLIKIAEAVKNLPFGESSALPWCRESFPELDTAMKEYEGIQTKHNQNMPWREINEEQWNDWLEILPPEKWQSVNEVDIFRLSEREIGDIARHCAQYRGRFFTSYRRTTENYKDLASQIKTICHDGEAQ